jgi:hypothetical protein
MEFLSPMTPNMVEVGVDAIKSSNCTSSPESHKITKLKNVYILYCENNLLIDFSKF